MYTLVVVWNDNKTETYSYPTLEIAMRAEDGFHRAFGNQVWTAIRC